MYSGSSYNSVYKITEKISSNTNFEIKRALSGALFFLLNAHALKQDKAGLLFNI